MQRGRFNLLAGARAQLLLSALLLGLMAVVARLASSGLGAGSGAFTPGQLGVVRFAVGGSGSLLLSRLKPGTFRPVRYRLLATRGLLGGAAVMLSLSRSPGSRRAKPPCSTTPFRCLRRCCAIHIGERPTLHLVLALALTSAGVVFVLGGGSLRLQIGWGELAGIGSALIAGGSVISISAPCARRTTRPPSSSPSASADCWSACPFRWAIGPRAPGFGSPPCARESSPWVDNSR